VNGERRKEGRDRRKETANSCRLYEVVFLDLF
jgi:hypothetical protein